MSKRTIENMIGEFNYTILNLEERPYGLQPDNEHMLTLKQLREEVKELEDAHDEGDFIKAVDSLQDLIYFAIGALLKHGLTPEDVRNTMEIIHNCNMNKKKGVKETRIVEGNPADAIKPEGWVPPEEKLQEYFDSKEK